MQLNQDFKKTPIKTPNNIAIDIERKKENHTRN